MKNLTTIKHFFLLSFISLSIMSCEESNNCIETCDNGIENFMKSNHKITLKRSKELFKNYQDSIQPYIKAYQENKNYREKTIATLNFEKKLISKFQNEPSPDLDEATDLSKGYQPTNYVLVNIETLKCYLKFLEEVEKENQQKITGLALFLGANGEGERLENMTGHFNNKMKEERKLLKEKNSNLEPKSPIPTEEDISERLTMFFAPTYYIGDENPDLLEEQRHIPFFIKNPKDSQPYVGDYESLIKYFNGDISISNESEFYENTNNNSNFKVTNFFDSSTGTSLSLDEFTQMPPKPNN